MAYLPMILYEERNLGNSAYILNNITRSCEKKK